MLTQRKKTKNLFFNHLIILDIEGFRCGKKPLIIKELSVCSAISINTIIFCHQFNSINYQKKRKKLTIGYLNLYAGFVGTKMNTLTHTCIKILTAFVSGTQTPIFFAKGTQKSVSLAEYLKLPITMTNMEDIDCPKIEQLLGQEKHICKRHSHLLPSHQLLKHCTRRKSQVFFNWLQNELSNDANNLITKINGLRFND